MQALYDGLRDHGVRDERIQAEAFGLAALRRRVDGPSVNESARVPPTPPDAGHRGLHAHRRNLGLEKPAHGSLLDFAEGKGPAPQFSGRPGLCGSCVTRIGSGEVT